MKAVGFAAVVLALCGTAVAGPEARQSPPAPSMVMTAPATLWLLPVASGKKGKKKTVQFDAPFFYPTPLFRRMPSRYVTPSTRAAPAPRATGVEQREK